MPRMNLELSDKQAALLERELRDIEENDRYPFSPRIRVLRAILDKLRPAPVREPYRRRNGTSHREGVGDGEVSSIVRWCLIVAGT